MPSPVTPSQFKALIPSASGATCDKLMRALFTFPTRFVDWYSYVFKEDGNFTDDFKADLCAIDCSTATGGTGTDPSVDVPSVSIPTLYDGKVRLEWGAVPGAGYYEVVRNTVNDPLTATLVGATSITYFEDLSTTPLTFYFYWVRARTVTTVGGFSASVVGYARSGSTIPDYPLPEVSATGSPAYVKLQWANVPGAASYEVRRSPSNDPNDPYKVNVATTSQLYALDFSAVAGTAYYYFVRADNNLTASWSVGVVGTKA